MGQSAERFLYPPTVAVCPRCIEVSLQSTVFHSGLDWAHQRSLISSVPGVWCLTIQQAETPAVLLAGHTAVLMPLFGSAFRLSCEGSLRWKVSPAMKDWLAHSPFPAVCAPHPSLLLLKCVHIDSAVKLVPSQLTPFRIVGNAIRAGNRGRFRSSRREIGQPQPMRQVEYEAAIDRLKSQALAPFVGVNVG
jgi:hypothetical protein